MTFMQNYSSNNSCYNENKFEHNNSNKEKQMTVQGYFKCCYYPTNWCDHNEKQEKDYDFDCGCEKSKGYDKQDNWGGNSNFHCEKQENNYGKQKDCGCKEESEDDKKPCFRPRRNCCCFCNRRFF